MQQSTSFFSAHLCICIAKYESDRGKEVTLPRAIPPHDDIVFGGERLDDSLLFVTVKC